jgi:pimeloyl-ACP methyl ester carboxylesterase
MAIKEIYYRDTIFPIAYDMLHPSNRRDFIVLHGWGSNKEIMKGAFARTLPQFRHIYIDLPGFGKSPCDQPLKTEDYAQIVSLFLDTIKSDKAVVAGHSFGGKVAVLLEPDLLVLLSSAGIPVPKPFSVRFKIALFKRLKQAGLGGMRKLFASKDAAQMSEAMYETFKNVVDEDFTQIFAKRSDPALLFWGKSDTATPLWTGEKIASLMPNSKLTALDGDHFFFTRHADTIAQTITQEYHATGS